LPPWFPARSLLVAAAGLAGRRRAGCCLRRPGCAALAFLISGRVEFPGRRRQARPETPDAAARRELAEEIGLVAPRLLRAGEATGIWNGWRYRVHFFELRLERLPQLQLDNREIIGARLASPEELRNMEVTGPIAA